MNDGPVGEIATSRPVQLHTVVTCHMTTLGVHDQFTAREISRLAGTASHKQLDDLVAELVTTLGLTQ